jgi:hypothetical protein
MDDHRSAEEAEREMKAHGDELQEQIDDTRADWERKKDDSAVPGAADRPEAGEEENRLPDGPG